MSETEPSATEETEETTAPAEDVVQATEDAVDELKETLAAAEIAPDDRPKVDARIAELEAEVERLTTELAKHPLDEEEDEEPETVAEETAEEPEAAVVEEAQDAVAPKQRNHFKAMMRRSERH